MRYLIGFMCVLALGIAFVACGGEEGCAEPVDVEGNWQMTSTVVSDSCDGRENQTFLMTITQDANALTAETPELTFNGTICGNQIQMKGSFPEDGGTVTVNAALTVSAEGDSMQGSDTWTWTDGSMSCSGSDSLDAIRVADCIDNICPCSEAGIRVAIAEGGGPFAFDCDGPRTVVTKSEIVISKDVTLDGQGDLTVDGNGSHRVFGVEESVMAELNGFVITNGDAIEGAGVYNLGDLTIEDSTVRGNTAETSAGIRNQGTLSLVNSTVSGNTNTGAETGAGIHNDNGTATVTNSTVSENTGQGIRNAGDLTLVNSTVSGNTDGAIYDDAGDSILRNTLIDGDCDDVGETVSLGYNIEIRGNTCGLDPDGTDLVNVPDPMLGPLQDNGGPTWTHALLPGSPAINQIPEAACEVETDQRGKPRPETGGTMCDVGAFERQPEALDLLILIDDSASMRDEQDKFAEQVPRLVNLLLTGGAAEPTAVGEFPEVESLHVGIITPDLGWSTEPMTSYSPPGDFNPTAACERNNGSGKAGFMQVEGLRGEPRVPCQAQTPPEGTLYLNYPEPGFTAADLISDVECLTGQSDGCGFEQQLEAILASDRNTVNRGFSREGALLAIILITDEDDCSTTDPRVFDVEPRPGNPYQGPFTSMNEVQFNLRCWAHSQALQQIQRYVDSFADLKGDPSQVVFAAITGIPEDSALDRENFNSDEERYDAILAADAMQEVPDPSTDDTQGQQLTPACAATDGSGSAAPGRRIVETMRGLAADNTGVGTVVESICAADYARAVNVIVDRIAAALRRQ